MTQYVAATTLLLHVPVKHGELDADHIAVRDDPRRALPASWQCGICARMKSGSAGFIVEAPQAQRKGFGRVDLRELVRDPDDVLDRAIAADLDFSSIALPPIAKEVAELLGCKCGIFCLSAICEAQHGSARPASSSKCMASNSGGFARAMVVMDSGLHASRNDDRIKIKAGRSLRRARAGRSRRASPARCRAPARDKC